GAVESLEGFRLEAELGHVETKIFFVQQAHDDLLAPQHRKAANAVIQLLLFAVQDHLQHDAAILWQALFADVQPGHDLDARSNGVFQFERRAHDVLQHAVNTEADAVFLFVGLNVDVAGATLDGVGKDQVDQLYDRRF